MPTVVYQDTLGTKNTTDIFVRSALTLEERLVLGAQGGVLLVAPDATDRVVQPVRRGRSALRLQETKKQARFVSSVKIHMRKRCFAKTGSGQTMLYQDRLGTNIPPSKQDCDKRKRGAAAVLCLYQHDRRLGVAVGA
jgi:hypothetical protein